MKNKFDIAREYRSGFVSSITSMPTDESKGPHWQHGYHDGYLARKQMGISLNKYLESIGAETMKEVRLQ